MKNRGDKWTTEEISLTKELYQKGMTISQIVLQVNHSNSAVSHKINELGLSCRKGI